MHAVHFDSRGTASLDGTWELFPGDHDLDDLDALDPAPIRVPGLWEAQGHLELDGTAWYRRRFDIEHADGHWSIGFAAAMDLADVYLNGIHLGHNDLPFTPFEFDAGVAIRAGSNQLAVRVVDPSLDDPEHLRLPHGKQGWMNHVFPSRPSLVLTYGGIWQPVTIRRHGSVVIQSVFAGHDPGDVTVRVEVESRATEEVDTEVTVRTLGYIGGQRVTLPARARRELVFPLGSTTAPRWSPEDPVLHDVEADVHVGDVLSDVRSARFGLRTVRVEGARLLVNDEPYRMKSVLVPGFTADELYAEGPREAIEHEVRAAKDMGFNTLRLHIKAFDPTYLDVCDQVGIFVHCDLPVSEPIAHEEMGTDTVLAQRCRRAVEAQVRRDRNHPSIILWSAMNELCGGNREARQWDRYEAFARMLVGTVHDNDGTRPVIENDWIEPDPDRIFASPIVTAHWYGQLHRDHLDRIEQSSQLWSGMGRPFFVSEFGDWGLPHMPDLEEPPFWDTRQIHTAGLAGALWPSTIGRFAAETQRYQGISDRLQTEVWRRHDDIGGYCLTELTDVPPEFNGLLDLHRRPKPLAVAEVRRANQTVLPMLELDSLVAGAGEALSGTLHVANDGPALLDVDVEVGFGATAAALGLEELLAHVRCDELAAHHASTVGPVSVIAPEVPGSHDLVLRLCSRGRLISENRYPIHVVAVCRVAVDVQAVGDGSLAEALRDVGTVTTTDTGTLVIGEGALDAGSAPLVVAALDAGRTVLVLAQNPDAGAHIPGALEIAPVATAWGSTVFHFTTDHGALPSLPRRNVLVAEDSTIQAISVVTRVGSDAFPDTPVVIAYKPAPGAITGTIVGSHAVGPGRVVFCQYRLTDRAVAGDAAARAVLADLVRWAASPAPVVKVERTTMPDGRKQISYAWPEAPT